MLFVNTVAGASFAWCIVNGTVWKWAKMKSYDTLTDVHGASSVSQSAHRHIESKGQEHVRSRDGIWTQRYYL